MASAAGQRILVSLATYNERDNLAPLVEEIHAVVPQADVLVIDDHSPDGTGDLADQLAAADPRIRVMHRAACAERLRPGLRRRMAHVDAPAGR